MTKQMQVIHTNTIAVYIPDRGMYCGTLEQVAWVEREHSTKEHMARDIASYTEGYGIPDGIGAVDWWLRYPQAVLAVVLADLLAPVQCATCGTWGLEAHMHYPGNDPESGPRHARITQQEMDRRHRAAEGS